MSTVTIVATGIANLASVRGAFARLGAATDVAADAAAVRDAARVVLPGVGSFGAGMQALREQGLVDALRERLLAGRATLAVCLGMQLACTASEEDPGVPGLGVLAGTVTRFSPSVRVPQLGWNAITPDGACRLLQREHVYFANSYCLRSAPTGYDAAHAEHGGTFVAGLERGAVLLCQFHPELSARGGSDLLRRWLDTTEDTAC